MFDGILTLPIENPVLIFFIVLAIILLAPILLNRFRIPHIIGLIIAGIIIGPHGFNLLARDSSFEIFGQVGILYLMFLAGIEMDIFSLIRNRKPGTIFGLLTFGVPMVLGTVASHYLLHLD
ncbi:MAG: cation:proton antiporter, partial [Bacteroidaceae bacterium]|nr:cation:proton antiporter [Bacteroidaceae bacterium]